jgi:hypothetical protein
LHYAVPGPINRHNRRGDDKLSRRYRRKRDEDPSYRDELDGDPYEDVDDYWNPRSAAGPLDFHLQQVWEQVLSVALAPSLVDFLPEPERTAWTPATAAASTRDIAPADLPDALHRHLESAISRTSRHDYLERLRQLGTLDDIRAAVLKTPALGRWFADQRGPAVMALVLAPFWLRPLTAWSPPDDASTVDAVTASLLDHLFARYPLPKPLYHAWEGSSLPTLKWACWTVLLGRGASLHRAAATFGWQVTARFTHHLLSAPAELATVDAVMWAEVARLGGTPIEYHRLCAHHAYRIDPTSGTADPARMDAADDEAGWDDERTNTTPGFWRATVGWLAHHRDNVDDDQCQWVLDWAMHCHTEDLALGRAEDACFTWHGRDPEAAIADAIRYRDFVRGRHRAGRFDGTPLTWKPRGWDWEVTQADVTWSIRELATDTELLDEGAAMRHCVSSYSYACARGEATIFSLVRNGVRRATIQIDPRTRELVQARGVRNKNCVREDLDVLATWLGTIVGATP